MSLRIKRSSTNHITKGLIGTSALFLFLLASCNDPADDLGYKVGEIDEIGAQTDSFEITISTVLYDPLVSSIPGEGANVSTTSYRSLMAGTVTDPEFGATRAEAFFQLAPVLSKFSIDTAAVYDSMQVYLSYQNFFGDTTGSQTLQFYELQQAPAVGTPYTVVSEGLPYQHDSLLGEMVFDEVLVDSLLKTNTSGLVRVNTNAYGKRIFDFLNSIDSLSGRDEFTAVFPGLALVPKEENGTMHTFGFPTRGSGQVMAEVFYHVPPNDTTARKIQLWLANDSTAYFRVAQSREGTPLAGLQDAGDELQPSATNQKVFSQQVTNIRSRILLGDLARLQDIADEVVIIRADLILRPQLTVGYPLPPPVKLVELREDGSIRSVNNGKTELTIKTNVLSGSQSGVKEIFQYNPAGQLYQIDITDYITTRISSDAERAKDARWDLGLTVAGAPTLNRVVFYGPDSEMAPAQLKVYYVPVMGQ
ncbi:protein of unknown function [Catalinimonas alkaloidigena]|uniref:DUF4270 domain-containing protein n=1 Tax=Catalinimonas alkaloidigena TaxID=1075417 RepID=A0A1G9ERC8_9BACT|nr:protein of unknown function [Catalinimonas alkaloidigena]